VSKLIAVDAIRVILAYRATLAILDEREKVVHTIWRAPNSALYVLMPGKKHPEKHPDKARRMGVILSAGEPGVFDVFEGNATEPVRVTVRFPVEVALWLYNKITGSSAEPER